MAAAKKKAKPKPKGIVTESADAKAARAAINRSRQLAVEASAGRIGTATRGAFTRRQLRQGGTTLLAYDQGRFTPTYGGALPGSTGSNNAGTAAGGRTGSATPRRHTEPTQQRPTKAQVAKAKRMADRAKAAGLEAKAKTAARTAAAKRARTLSAIAKQAANVARARKAAEAASRKKPKSTYTPPTRTIGDRYVI